MPTTSVEKINGAMRLLIRRMKMVLSGRSETPTSGASQPISRPIPIPMKIIWVSEILNLKGAFLCTRGGQ